MTNKKYTLALLVFLFGSVSFAAPLRQTALENELMETQPQLYSSMLPANTGKSLYAKKEYKDAWDTWLKAATERDDKTCQYLVATIYLDGDENIGIAKDEAKAVEWLLKSAPESPEGSLLLAQLYLKGEGVPKDLKKFMFYLTKSAESNYSEAQYFLALVYREGEGVEKNTAKSVEWYTKAANNLSVNAQKDLGEIYNKGLLGQAVNLKSSFDWYSKAARTDAEAQYQIGNMYLTGQGTQTRYGLAYGYYLLAETNGFVPAKANVEKMRPALSSEQIQEGEELFIRYKKMDPKKE